jgi:talin
MLKNEDILEYRNKFRQLQIRLLDGQIHKLMTDDSQIVSQLMIDICSKIGIANYDEYSLINDISENEKEKTATLKKVELLGNLI